jgi:hypothetical protein
MYRGLLVRWMVLTPTVTLLLAACGGDDPAARTAADASTPTAAPPSGTPSSTPSATPSSARDEPLKAADGTRLKACADAKCEVVVSAGDVIRFSARVRNRTGLPALTVKSVSRSEVAFAFTTLGGGDYAYSQPPGLPPTVVQGVSLTVRRVNGDRAVMRLGEPAPGAASVEGGSGGMQVTTPGG